MATSVKKIVNEVIISLEKIPSPEKNGNTFWNYLKEQLYSESTWDQKDLKVIEKEIHSKLDKLNKKDLTTLWEDCDSAQEKLDEGNNPSDEEKKADLTNDILGQVMDRMDDNYSGRSSYQSAAYYTEEPSTKSKSDTEEEGSDSENIDPDNIDGDMNFDDDEELFNEDNFEDEDDSNF